VANGLVYIVDHVGQNDVTKAFNLATGAQVWEYSSPEPLRFNYGYTEATPTVYAGNVYVYTRNGTLLCMKALDGKLVWKRDIVTDFHGAMPNYSMACSPMIDKGHVIVYASGPNAAVVAIDAATGATVWAGGGSGQAGYSTAVVATMNGTRQYVCMLNRMVEGVDAATGNVLWSYPWNIVSGEINAATPIVIGNNVFVTSGYGHGCAMLDISNNVPTVRWQNTAIQAHFSSPIYYDGHIYGTGDPGRLTCLDRATGNVLWTQQGFEKGGIIAVDGEIIAFNGASGDLILVDLSPTAYHELGRFNPLGGQSWTAPIVAYGKLIVRNKTALACLDLR
jgi:outer membrane protein assembly factor BamB